MAGWCAWSRASARRGCRSWRGAGLCARGRARACESVRVLRGVLVWQGWGTALGIPAAGVLSSIRNTPYAACAPAAPRINCLQVLRFSTNAAAKAPTPAKNETTPNSTNPKPNQRPPVRNVPDAREGHALRELLGEGGQPRVQPARHQQRRLHAARPPRVLNHPLQGPACGCFFGGGGGGGMLVLVGGQVKVLHK